MQKYSTIAPELKSRPRKVHDMSPLIKALYLQSILHGKFSQMISSSLPSEKQVNANCIIPLVHTHHNDSLIFLTLSIFYSSFLCFPSIHLHLYLRGFSTKESNLLWMKGRAGADLHGEMLKRGGEEETNGERER